MRRVGVAVGTLVAALVAASAAPAATSTTNFAVSAQVVASATVSATPLSFGIYSPLTALDATNTIDVTATAATPYTMALNTGLSGSFAPRAMTSGADQLAYNIFTDVARTTVWGDGTGATVTQAGTGTGVSQSYTGYGRIPAGQSVPPALYSDTVTVTVTF